VTPRVPIVGISGLAGAGKDTVARILVERLGFEQIALADPMKRAVADWFGWDAARLWGPSENRNAPDPRYPRKEVDGTDALGDIVYRTSYLTPRQALQQLGTQWGRECYQDVWVDYALRTARVLLSGGCTYGPVSGLQPAAPDYRAKGVAISDVRFRNELEAIRRAGGIVLRVVRPGAGLAGAAAGHASEVEQQSIPDTDFDAVIRNTGTIDELGDVVVVAVRFALQGPRTMTIEEVG
jgi:hypothetical protein